MSTTRRGLLGGLIWLTVLFVVDTLDSVWLLGRSMSRIHTDEATITMLRDGVIDYVARMAGAYLLLALVAGIACILALRVWFSDKEGSRRQTWVALGLGAALVTLLGNMRQMISFPTLHDWFPWRLWWIDHVDLWMVDLTSGCLFAAWLFAAWRRWAGPTPWDFVGRVALLVGWVGGVLLLLRSPEPSPAQTNTGPNVVLLGIDALRPDHLGFHGYTRDTAPNIDALLEESVVFESAWSPLARTYPAWISMLSGSLPLTHGVRDNLPAPSALVPEQALLPQVFGSAGWHTAFVTDDSRFSYMIPETGFSTIVQPPVGVQNFAVSVNEPRYRSFHGLLHNPLGFALVPTTAHNQAFGKSYRPDDFVDEAVDVLAEVSQHERFFYALHSCVLHAPGDRVRPWYHMWGQRGYEGTNRLRYSRSGTMLIVEDEEKGLSANEVNSQDVRIYDSGIDMADRLVAGMVAELKASGLWDNTIVVLFSDHGEALYADDLPYRYAGPNHGFHAYGDGQFKVVLAIRFPDGAHRGERVEAPVRLIDLAPTLAEHFGLSWPNEIDGLSLAPLMRGEDEEEERLVYLETGLSEPRYWAGNHLRYPFKKVSERYRADTETGRVHIRPEFKPQLVAAKDRALQVGKWKMVWLATKDGRQFKLFDRRYDSFNRHPLSKRHPRYAPMMARMKTYLALDGITFEEDEAPTEPAVPPSDGEDEARE